MTHQNDHPLTGNTNAAKGRGGEALKRYTVRMEPTLVALLKEAAGPEGYNALIRQLCWTWLGKREA